MASATLHPFSLSSGSPRRTEGRRGCDRAIPNPNRLIEYLSYKIKHLLKNTVLLYSPGSHASPLNAGLGAEKLWQFCIATTI
jgi:hypothetical protein